MFFVPSSTLAFFTGLVIEEIETTSIAFRANLVFSVAYSTRNHHSSFVNSSTSVTFLAAYLKHDWRNHNIVRIAPLRHRNHSIVPPLRTLIAAIETLIVSPLITSLVKTLIETLIRIGRNISTLIETLIWIRRDISPLITPLIGIVSPLVSSLVGVTSPLISSLVKSLVRIGSPLSLSLGVGSPLSLPLPLISLVKWIGRIESLITLITCWVVPHFDILLIGYEMYIISFKQAQELISKNYQQKFFSLIKNYLLCSQNEAEVFHAQQNLNMN